MADTTARQEAIRLITEAQTFSLGGMSQLKGPPAIAAAILDLADAVRELRARAE